MTARSGVTREGLLWSRDLHDMQEPPAKGVQEGGPFQAQRTTGTNSPEQECARHLTKKAVRPAWLLDCTEQEERGGGGGAAGGWGEARELLGRWTCTSAGYSSVTMTSF